MVALTERLRRSNPLPEGALPVAAGLVVTGVATYGLFAITSRVLDESDYSALAVMWTLLFAVGNGVMQPLEQEVARAVSDRRARGQGSAPVIRRAAMVGIGFTGVLAAAAFVGREWMADELFGGNGALVLALLVGLLGFCVGHLVRGTLSSHGRFGSYGTFFAVDGITRPMVVGILALAGVAAVGAYGFVVAVAPFLGTAAALQGERGLLQPGPQAAWPELTANLGWLLLGTTSIALLLNGGAIAVELLAGGEQSEAAGVFLNGLVIARIPLFLFQAVVAALLPKLSHQLGVGDHQGFVAAMSRLMGAIAVVGAATTLVVAAVGPPVIGALFGTEQVLTSRDVALLATGSFVYMAAMAMGQALIALGGHSRMAICAVVGLGVFTLMTAVGDDLYLRVELGLLVGSLAALISMTAFVRSGVRKHRGAHGLTLAEAVADLPIEP